LSRKWKRHFGRKSIWPVTIWAFWKLDLLWAGQTRPLLLELDEQVRRHRGYKIGSGEVEGACKHLVGRRLKQSGMIWSRKGSSAILALRIAWLNQEWDALWKSNPLQFIRPAV
jgi:hypothetical protein